MTFDVTYTKQSENLDEDIGIAVLVVGFLSLVFAGSPQLDIILCALYVIMVILKDMYN